MSSKLFDSAACADLGCGTGKWGLKLLKSGFATTFVDHSAAMIEQVREKLSSNPRQRKATLHVADIITTAMEFGNSGDPVVPALATGAWEQLGLSSTVLGAVAEQVERQVNEVTQSILTVAV